MCTKRAHIPFQPDSNVVKIKGGLDLCVHQIYPSKHNSLVSIYPAESQNETGVWRIAVIGEDITR